MLHMPRPRRHLGLLQKGHHASKNSVLSSRWYRMFPQLWGGAYGDAIWCMYSESIRLSLADDPAETVLNGALGCSPSPV